MDTLTPQELAFNEWWAENFKDLAYQGVGKTVARIGWNAAWQTVLQQELQPLRDYLESTRQAHDVSDEDCWYACPKSGESCNDERKDICTCGAGRFNERLDKELARIDAALEAK